MKLHYYPETDSLYIELAIAPGTEVREIVEGLVADFDADGNVVGLDIDRASRKLDLSKVETHCAAAGKRGGVSVARIEQREIRVLTVRLAPDFVSLNPG